MIKKKKKKKKKYIRKDMSGWLDRNSHRIRNLAYPIKSNGAVTQAASKFQSIDDEIKTKPITY